MDSALWIGLCGPVVEVAQASSVTKEASPSSVVYAHRKTRRGSPIGKDYDELIFIPGGGGVLGYTFFRLSSFCNYV